MGWRALRTSASGADDAARAAQQSKLRAAHRCRRAVGHAHGRYRACRRGRNAGRGPHHGSRSSSTAEFIAAVAPSWAIVPVGYRSRFGHPNAEVLERYRAAGVRLLRTDRDGAIAVKMGADITLETERHRRGRYWLQ